VTGPTFSKVTRRKGEKKRMRARFLNKREDNMDLDLEENFGIEVEGGESFPMMG